MPNIDMRVAEAAVAALLAEHAPPPADPLRRLWEEASTAAPGADAPLDAGMVRLTVERVWALERRAAAWSQAARRQRNVARAEREARVWHTEHRERIIAQQADRLFEVNARVAALEDAIVRLNAAWDALCRCVDEFEPEQPEACAERRDALDTAILAVFAAAWGSKS